MTDTTATDPFLAVLAETYEDALAATREARRDLLEGTTAYVGRLIRQALPDAVVLVVDIAERELLEVTDRTGSTLWYAPASAGSGLPDSLLEQVNRLLGDALDFGSLSDQTWGAGPDRYWYVSLTVADVRLRRTARAFYPSPEGLAQVTAGFTPGEAAFTLDGANERYSRETRDRVRAGIVNSGFAWPAGQVALVAHWSVVRGGSGADLTLACTLLAALGHLDPRTLDGVAMVGEIGLNGAVLPARDVTQGVRHALDAGVHKVLVAEQDAAGLECPDGVTVHGVRDLRHALAVLTETPEQA
jgi:hypothetical protein